MDTDKMQEDDLSWTLPNPPVDQDRLHSAGNSQRELLEDVEMELLALAWRTAAEMNVVNPAAGEGWPSAQRDLERVLSTQGCKFMILPAHTRRRRGCKGKGVLLKYPAK